MASNRECPSGGQWWVCTGQSPTFFGCCTSDPCNGIGCPHSNLRPLQLPSQGPTLGSNASCPQGEWYECKHTKPTFQGCCVSDACKKDNGCPFDDLRQASFATTSANDHEDPKPSKEPGSTIYTTAIISTVSGSSGQAGYPVTTIVTSTIATNSPTNTPVTTKDTSPNVGKVAGTAVGSVVGFLLILGAIFALKKWRQKKRRERIGYPRLSGGPSLGGNVDILGAGWGAKKGGSGIGGLVDLSTDPEGSHRAYLDKLDRDG